MLVRRLMEKKYLGFNATAPKEVSEKILEDLTVEENQYTFKIKRFRFR